MLEIGPGTGNITAYLAFTGLAVMSGISFYFVKTDHLKNNHIFPQYNFILIYMKAFVLLNTELGMESKIIEALNVVEEITNIHSLYGIYDLIIELEAESMDKIKEVVFNKVRRLDNVKSTITLLTYGEPLLNE